MPFRLWPKRKLTQDSHLEARVRRLEKNPKAFVTWPELRAHWNSMSAGNGLLQRVEDLKVWHTDTEGMIAEFVKDLAVAESKLNRLFPLQDDDDDDAKVLGDSATVTERILSPEPFSYNNVEPLAAASKLSMSKLPTTFTRRSSGSTERTALDASSLRLS
jgi:hypothetical protein